MDFNELKNKVLAALGQATDSAKDIAGKAADSAKDLAGKAADKAKVGGRIAKLSMEVATEKENMKKAYLEIGKLYYDTHKDNPDGFFIQLCEEVSAAEKSVAEKEAEIAELKESFSCGDSEPDVEVEFEEVVEKAEAEAAGETAETASESASETVAETVETVKEAVENIVEAAAEKADAVETAADTIEEKVEE